MGLSTLRFNIGVTPVARVKPPRAWAKVKNNISLTTIVALRIFGRLLITFCKADLYRDSKKGSRRTSQSSSKKKLWDL